MLCQENFEHQGGGCRIELLVERNSIKSVQMSLHDLDMPTIWRNKDLIVWY